MKKGIITLPNVPYELISKMKNKWFPFCVEQGIAMPTFEFRVRERKFHAGGSIITMESNPITRGQLGAFGPGIEKAWFHFFNPIEWPAPQTPYLHVTLNLRYELKSGGENGVPIVIDGSESIYYGVIEEKWMTAKQVRAAMDPACKTCKPKMTLPAYYKNLFS